MEKIKRSFQLVMMAVFGGLVSLGAYRYADTGSILKQDNVAIARPAGYDIKNITVPSFDFADVSEAVTPTVVYIKTKFTEKGTDGDGRQQRSPFDDLFGNGFSMPKGPQEASGSGVIISDKGYIVTNNHVVKDAEEIEVVLNDKRAFKADVIGKDPNTDVALLKINADGLTAVKFGNSDNVRVGEWVLAVGNPFNLTSTVTAGIVSAKGRSLNMMGRGTAIESFIQTDAAINPGNSGGALINTKGELVGINTAIASETGSYAGYSFAVPVNIVDKVVKDLMEFGEVQRGFLGVGIQDVDNKLAEDKDLKSTKGVYVNTLTDNGAAEVAGIKKGDVILKIDGHDVNSVPALQENIGRHKPGDEVGVLVNRDGKEKEVNVILRNKDGKTGTVTSATKELKKLLGAQFETPTESEMKKLKIANGVKVKSIEKGKFKDSNIPEGFIIIAIDKSGIYSSNDIYHSFQDKKGGVMVEGYLPGGEHKYYVLEMGHVKS
jgi:serine protease Do